MLENQVSVLVLGTFPLTTHEMELVHWCLVHLFLLCFFSCSSLLFVSCLRVCYYCWLSYATCNTARKYQHPDHPFNGLLTCCSWWRIGFGTHNPVWWLCDHTVVLKDFQDEMGCMMFTVISGWCGFLEKWIWVLYSLLPLWQLLSVKPSGTTIRA